jgi:hypothetical protein
MPFNWREFFALARWLDANAPPGFSTEAVGRVVVSRAYYAAFCYARNYARDYLGFMPRSNDTDHGYLRAHLRQRRRNATAANLERLRDWRNQCDYDDDLSIPMGQMLTAAVADAEYVFRSLPPPATP